MVSTLGAAGIRPGVQITGTTPPYQPATTGYKRRHPAPALGDIAADGAIVAQYTDQSHWGGAGILWSHWNEPGRTQFDCAKGFDIDNTPIVETQVQYETRRKGLKLQALYATRDTFKARASKATYNIGLDSTWCLASVLAGDTRSSNGRTVPDGRTFRDALFDEYDANIKTDATVAPITRVTSNDFASRSAIITSSAIDFNGADYPLIFTQGGPALFKVSTDDDGGDDQDPAPDTHMGPTCQMATMMLNEWETPAVAQRHWSYWVGGQDAFISIDGLGGYTKRHRFTAVKLLTTVPTRRVMLSAVKQSPSGDADAYGQQGLIGFAGIDPGGQTAAVCVWNETTTAKTITLAPRNLPVALQDAAAQHTTLDEATPLGSTTGWAGEPITLQPRTMHIISWAGGTSLQMRRQPLQTETATPRFLSRVDTYKRPKGACAYLDQVRGVAWLCPSSTSATKITTGAAWDGLPDSIWLTFYAHNIDASSAPLTVTVDYGGGAVTLLNSTVGAVVPGAPVQINLLASAPGGWSAGARRANILVGTQNASDQRIECWFSGTLAKAQAVAA
jgi:hemin uptake protein HemP